MCGIFGYAGKANGIKIALDGLRRLEYRGYDSAGLGVIDESGRLFISKKSGKVSQLAETLHEELPISAETVIAHTRWATHGVPDDVNAHPHTDAKKTIAIVHNGIIENYAELKRSLSAEGVLFTSDTDTEIVANLLAKNYQGDVLESIRKTIPLLRGSYAIACIHTDHPQKIFAFAHGLPLVIGTAANANYLSSDPQAFPSEVTRCLFLENNEIIALSALSAELFTAQLSPMEKRSYDALHCGAAPSKEGHAHFTLKEIFEQGESLRRALHGRINLRDGSVYFDELNVDLHSLSNVSRIVIVACGTSYYAGCVAKLFFEEITYLPTQVEIASEYRYQNPIVQPGTLAIAISQSGETADTLAAVAELQAKGVRIIGLTNAIYSTLARVAQVAIDLRAGPEIGVCSTKAFTNQLATLFLLAVLIARQRTMDRYEAQALLMELLELPEKIELLLKQAGNLEEIARQYSQYQDVFFIGRNYLFPVALEGALKLKEIAYVNANGYPAGELKHGPIALISEKTLTVALCANDYLLEKVASNIQEIRARRGPVFALVDEKNSAPIASLVQTCFSIPTASSPFFAVLAAIALQLFAYYVALHRGTEIDQPKNLAKSVTVE